MKNHCTFYNPIDKSEKVNCPNCRTWSGTQCRKEYKLRRQVMCEDYRRDRRVEYNEITEHQLALCDKCVHERKNGCILHGRNGKTALVHEPVPRSSKGNRRVFR